jgi:tellurite resistance protein TerC
MKLLLWIGFIIFVLVMLAIDLLIFNRKTHEIKIKEALVWSGVWIGMALLFNAGILIWGGKQLGLEFFTGYLLEKSLSVDNLFVFLMIFTYFKVPHKYQHSILFWGILGALVMRALFIAGGISLINKFHWIIYIFGVLLIISGLKMVSAKEKSIHPEKNPVLRFFRYFMPVTNDYGEGRFFAKISGKWFATQLFVVLLIIETTDVVFAVDSIPAVLAITRKPFIVYTSNVFAILGLRALYFALAGIMKYFRYLNYGLCLILVFVGVKMLLVGVYKIPITISLGVIFCILMASVIASVLHPHKETIQA